MHAAEGIEDPGAIGQRLAGRRRGRGEGFLDLPAILIHGKEEGDLPDIWDDTVVVKEPPRKEPARPKYGNLATGECKDKSMRALADRVHMLLCRKSHPARIHELTGTKYDQRTVCEYGWETWDRCLLTTDLRRHAYAAAEQIHAIAKKKWLSGQALLNLIEEVLKVKI